MIQLGLLIVHDLAVLELEKTAFNRLREKLQSPSVGLLVFGVNNRDS